MAPYSCTYRSFDVTRPYLHYLNHMSKLSNSRSRVSTHQDEAVEQVREKLEHQRQKDHQR